MSTIRRLYFYALSLISAIVVIWGVVGLLRTILSRGMVGTGSLLATSLSLVIVGLPIFLLHWRVAQRDSAGDTDERSSRVRAVFLYAALGATFGPVVFALLALLNRLSMELLGQFAWNAWFGSGQTPIDNLLAILINGIGFFYFWRILRADWLAEISEDHLTDTRRLYRYIWMVAGLVLTISGIYNLLRFFLTGLGPNTVQTVPMLAGGLSLLVVGAPLWYYFWQSLQNALGIAEERRSLLRLVVLYLISLAGVIGVLTLAGSVVGSIIRWALGEQQTIVEFFQNNSAQLGGLIPLAVMWAYYGRILNREVSGLADQPRSDALRRLYNYILSLLGLAVTFAGLFNLIDFITRLLFSNERVIETYRSLLAGALSALLVGLPLWFVAWQKMQVEARRSDSRGDHARRSALRKGYLYLVLFLLVIGAMTFAGQMIYGLLNAAFSGQSINQLAEDTTRFFLSLVVDIALLIYHLRALREDGRLAQQSLGSLHAAFPTLLLFEEERQTSKAFSEWTGHSLAQLAPRLPLALNPIERGAPDEVMLGAKAVLLPSAIALNPPEALRLWLAEYNGERILVPLPDEEWTWLGQGQRSPQDLGREAAHTLRQMSEGEALRRSLPSSPWAIAGYILGGLFGLQILFFLFSLMLTAFFR